MTSTSSEPVVLRGLASETVGAVRAGGDLRTGRWTRLGDGAVRGDAVTEQALGALAERTRDAARAEGYAIGWAEGRRLGLAAASAADASREARQAAEHERALSALRAAATALDAATARLDAALDAVVGEVADAAVDLALRIAEAVLAREVAVAADPGADALRRALTLVPPRVPVTVRLHPDDLAVLDPAAVGDRTAALVGDPSLSRGDAVVDTEDGVVDAGLAHALARVREVLL